MEQNHQDYGPSPQEVHLPEADRQALIHAGSLFGQSLKAVTVSVRPGDLHTQNWSFYRTFQPAKVKDQKMQQNGFVK